MDKQTEKSRELRKNMTTQERKLWSIIKNRQFFGYRFRRQFPIGRYIVDFVCREKKIIVEIDGGQHNEKQNIEYDNNRTEFLNSEGYQVVRFWNNEIDANLSGVYERLKFAFGIDNITPPQPSPSGEGVSGITPSQSSVSGEETYFDVQKQASSDKNIQSFTPLRPNPPHPGRESQILKKAGRSGIA